MAANTCVMPATPATGNVRSVASRVLAQLVSERTFQTAPLIVSYCGSDPKHRRMSALLRVLAFASRSRKVGDAPETAAPVKAMELGIYTSGFVAAKR